MERVLKTVLHSGIQLTVVLACAMSTANGFTMATLLYLIAIGASILSSSLATSVKDGESLLNSSWNAPKTPGTQPSVVDTDDDEDFPQLGFFIKDVLTTSLGTIHSSAAHRTPNPTRVVNLDQRLTNGSQNVNLSRLNYETFWHNGSLTLTLVDLEKSEQNISGKHRDVWDKVPEFELEDGVDDSNWIDDDEGDFFLDPKSRHHRRRRAVFGVDDRIEVSANDSNDLPYSAVVKISTGCTGTLIAPDHVLTAAHCVHDGMSYIIDVPHLKVGVLRRPGKVRWIRVDYMKVPRGWTLSHDYRYDYAVLKLHRHAPPPAGHLEIYEIPEHLPISIRIQFASFPADKPNFTLWYSYCKGHFRHHVIINRCDSYHGSSGAGIYGKLRKKGRVERFVMGVFTGIGNRVWFRGKMSRRNLGTKITPLKLAQIRSWLDAATLSKDASLVAAIPTP